MSDATAQPAERTPIDDFSQCHAGIMDRLADLKALPALVEAAARARAVAAQTLDFFDDVVLEHHAEEEQELFAAVLAAAADDEEREQVRTIVERLTREHRQVEAVFATIKTKLRAVAKGKDSDLDPAVVEDLVRDYLAHARYEETAFLPLSRQILGRDDKQMSALGLSLHLRHAVPQALSRGYI